MAPVRSGVTRLADRLLDDPLFLLTNGKPVLSLHAIRLVRLLREINRAFPKVAPRNGESR